MDDRGGDELGDVFIADAAGGDELGSGEGTGEALQGFQPAVNVGREELQDLEVVLLGHHDLGGSRAAGSHSDVVLHAPGHGLLVITRRDDELGAAVDGQLALFEVDDGTCTHQHLGDFLRHCTDRIRRRCRTEGDFHDVDPAGNHRACGRNSVLCLVQNDNGNDARSRQSA